MIERAGIVALIPHAGLMCLLDRVVRWDERSIRCAATTHRAAANPLAVNGQLSAMCGVEYAVQAMAAHYGLTGAVGAKPRGGYLANLSGLVLHVARLDDLGGILVIDADRLAAAGPQTIYSFRLECRGVPLVTGRAAVVLDAGKP